MKAKYKKRLSLSAYYHFRRVPNTCCHTHLPAFESKPPQLSTIGCPLGLTYDSCLTLGCSKCPADSFAVILQFVLPVTVSAFGRQVRVKRAQRSAGAGQVKDDRRRVSFTQPSGVARLSLSWAAGNGHSGTPPKLIVDPPPPSPRRERRVMAGALRQDRQQTWITMGWWDVWWGESRQRPGG